MVGVKLRILVLLVLNSHTLLSDISKSCVLLKKVCKKLIFDGSYSDVTIFKQVCWQFMNSLLVISFDRAVPAFCRVSVTAKPAGKTQISRQILCHFLDGIIYCVQYTTRIQTVFHFLHATEIFIYKLGLNTHAWRPFPVCPCTLYRFLTSKIFSVSSFRFSLLPYACPSAS
jgi:hypothetical protein